VKRHCSIRDATVTAIFQSARRANSPFTIQRGVTLAPWPEQGLATRELERRQVAKRLGDQGRQSCIQ